MTRTNKLDFGSGSDADLVYHWVTKRKLFSQAEACALPSAVLVFIDIIAQAVGLSKFWLTEKI